MTLSFTDEIAKIASIDLFKRNKDGAFGTGTFVGRPYQLDYGRALILVADAWKLKAKGMPQGSFLLAYYENEEDVSEALLLRVLQPAKLPTDPDVISSMIEYYKDNLRTAGAETQLDSLTRYEFSFSGLECRVLGTFYRDSDGKLRFGADVENYYSAHNYSAIKPNAQTLEAIVNFREGEVAGQPSDILLGGVRYSSSQRFQDAEDRVPVYVSPRDFLGKRTALFGMTRTGKSNTVKKIIQATVLISGQAKGKLDAPDAESLESNLEPFTAKGIPKYPVGQIIFDINGEYANANLQDAGTAIFDLYSDQTVRYSVVEKPGFEIMKVNFYRQILAGFGLIGRYFRTTGDSSDYLNSFLSVNLEVPDNYDGQDDEARSAKTRYDRLVAAYQCCLYRAGFAVPASMQGVRFVGNSDLNPLGGGDPSNGLSFDKAVAWFTEIWRQSDTHPFFDGYVKRKGKKWIDEDLRSVLVFLTRMRKPAATGNDISGYTKLRPLVAQHTASSEQSFSRAIMDQLSRGQIVIVDLSQGDPAIQRLYSEQICTDVFGSSMNRFIGNKPNNFIQFYFEEAHNLFPKKDDRDLSQVYNRIAKEGAKLNLGMVYATQEVSSISANILKNTQNWFVAHLNNDDETREIRKFYDYADFADSLVRFSASSDRGFVRMKTYSNPFVVPVQVDRFPK